MHNHNHKPDEWPIFILSLEGDEDRRAPLVSALSDMGMSAVVLIGVDGRRGLPAWAEKRVARQRQHPGLRPLTDGELACALSHANAYHKIVENNLPGAIIFEDDARLDAKFKSFFNARAHMSADMVLLGYGSCWVRRMWKKDIGAGIQLFRIAVTPVLAHGYCVSHAAALSLIEATTPIREFADWPCDISKMKVLAAYPRLAHQNAEDVGYSHLEADRSAEKHKDMLLSPWVRKKRQFRKRLRYSWWTARFAKLLSLKL